jgi:hypothetical protein
MNNTTRNLALLLAALLFLWWSTCRESKPQASGPATQAASHSTSNDPGSGPELTASTRSVEPAAPLEAAAIGICEQPGPDKLQQAMVSVEYYAERGMPAPGVQVPWLMSLEDTLNTVACDRTFGRDRRRFRAWEVARRLDRAKPGLLDSLSLNSGAKFLSMDAELGDKAYQACCADILSARLWPPTDDSPYNVAVSFMMDVHLPYEETAKGLDPHSWDDLPESGFQAITYLGGQCPNTIDAPAVAPEPALGKGWSGAILEDFEYGCQGGAPFCTAFRNHLHFDSVLDTAKQDFSLDYELCPNGSLGGQMPGTGEVGPGALLLDCGFTSAAKHPQRTADWSRVKGAKRLEFSQALCGSNGCQDDSVSFAQRVLVEATAIALCSRPGAIKEKCTMPNWDDQNTHPDRGEPELNAMCN